MFYCSLSLPIITDAQKFVYKQNEKDKSVKLYYYVSQKQQVYKQYLSISLTMQFQQFDWHLNSSDSLIVRYNNLGMQPLEAPKQKSNAAVQGRKYCS